MTEVYIINKWYYDNENFEIIGICSNFEISKKLVNDDCNINLISDVVCLDKVYIYSKTYYQILKTELNKRIEIK